MPFGLGHHPFFPLTPRTRLFAPATAFWSEKHDYLPDRRGEVPADLDYSAPGPVPERWINNGFEGWTGRARIEWPEHQLALDLSAPDCTRYFLFRSDTTFDPTFKGDFFCFEPMTHSANVHGRDDGGLVILHPGEEFSLSFHVKATSPGTVLKV
jgi:aldose 1-epimerase